MAKIKIKHIVSFVGAGVALGGLIFGDVMCKIHSAEITSHLCPAKEIITDTDTHNKTLLEADETVQKIAEEGITLLKNNGTLPLKVNKNNKYKINLFGSGSNNEFCYTGWGSGAATINSDKKITLKKAFENAGFEVCNDSFGLDPYSNNNALTIGKNFSDTAVVTISRRTGENHDPTEQTATDSDGRNKLQLTVQEENMINCVADNFDKTIVLINTGNAMELGFIENEKIDACLYVSYLGQSGSNAISKILSGEVNPSGHLVDTFVYDNTLDPTYANLLKESDQITYTENIYYGYKWYETADHENYFANINNKYGQGYNGIVQYPFGYGLSYTTFDWKIKSIERIYDDVKEEHHNGDSISSPKTKFEFVLEVTNTGDVAGKDVIEVYYTAPYYKNGIEKSYVNLVEFAKTDLINPSETKEVKINFDVYDLASYDCYDKNNNGFKGFELEPGEYHIKFMENSHKIKSNNMDITFNVENNNGRGYIYRFDNEGKGYVTNRFTGDSAEAGIPIDGSKSGGEKIKYLTRADFKNTFPSTRTPNRKKVDGSYYGDFYDNNKNLVAPTLNNKESNLKLFTLENGDAPTKENLKNRSGIVPNEELIMELGKDYNNPNWEKLLSQLSLTEISYIISSAGFGTKEIESIGKPVFLDYDGPTGFNYNVAGLADSRMFTGYPAGTLVAMTWNKDIAYEQGANLGKEAQSVGISGIYGPTVNLHRSPYYTRNFEAYSEDPVISGYIAANYIKGAKEHGLTTYLKHFVYSDPGMNPYGLNTWTTEQNLRENALKAFEIAVKDGKANAIMSAFNRIGSVNCYYSYSLLTRILRQEWGFKGVVITDYGCGNPTSLIRSGNDIKLFPNDSYADLKENNAVDVYCGVQAIKNSLYAYCSTYYTAKTYDPTVTITVTQRIQPFRWWIPTVVGLNVLVLGGIEFLTYKVIKSILKYNKEEDK